MSTQSHDQPSAGITPSAHAATSCGVSGQGQRQRCVLRRPGRAVWSHADHQPNFIGCRSRGDATQYEAYREVAGPEIANVGGSIAHYTVGIPDVDRAHHLSHKWEIVDLPVYPRRTTHLQLQQSSAYPLAISDRVGGTFGRLLYVRSGVAQNA